jgi:hypothetical protein
MRVAVVTPYFRESVDWLWQCHASVLAQTHPCTHIMVADGEPQAEVASWSTVRHMALPVNHADYGDTPRAVGSVEAIGSRFDAIAYLDADNSFTPDHIASLVELQRTTQATVCTSTRYLCRTDGTIMAVCANSDGESFADTNCLLFFRPAFQLVLAWVLMPHYAHPLCDRVVFHAIKTSKARLAHTGLPTVYYRCKAPGFYRMLREPIPSDVPTENPPALARALDRWEAAGGPSLRYGFQARRARAGYAEEEARRAADIAARARCPVLPSAADAGSSP